MIASHVPFCRNPYPGRWTASAFIVFSSGDVSEVCDEIDFPYDSLEKWFGPNPNSPRSIVAQALVLLSPIAAFLVSTAPTTRLRISIEEGQLVGSVSIRGNFLRVSTMALSLAIVAVLALYILTENVAEAAIRRYFGG